MVPEMAAPRTETHDAATVRKIAVFADCDPRTVCRYLENKTVRPSVARRIKTAIETVGILDGVKP